MEKTVECETANDEEYDYEEIELGIEEIDPVHVAVGKVWSEWFIAL